MNVKRVCVFLYSQEGLIVTPVITSAVNRPVFSCPTLAKGKSIFRPILLLGCKPPRLN